MPTLPMNVCFQGQSGSNADIAEPSLFDPEPTLDFASHNTKKRHSRPARGGMAEVVTTMHPL
jgi:hypothetical protein